MLLRHTEDMELHSLNYLHYGAPKVWYCVSPTHKKKMDAFVARRLYAQHDQCKDFMRHKVSQADLQLPTAVACWTLWVLPMYYVVDIQHLLFLFCPVPLLVPCLLMLKCNIAIPKISSLAAASSNPDHDKVSLMSMLHGSLAASITKYIESLCVCCMAL